MFPAAAHDPFQGLEQMVLAMGLLMARWMGVTILLPVFSKTGLTGITRGGFAFAMAVPLLPMGLGSVQALDPARASIDLVLLALKEGAVGIAIGALLGVPFWAAETAGAFLDVQRGAQGQESDPSGLDQSTVFGTFFAIVSIALFLIAGGIDVIASAVYDTYRVWPLASVAPTVEGGAGDAFVGLMDKIMVIALAVSAPLCIVALVSDILLGFIAKLAPQLNTNQLGAGIKSLIFTALIPVYAQFFLGDLTASFGGMQATLRQMEYFIK